MQQIQHVGFRDLHDFYAWQGCQVCSIHSSVTVWKLRNNESGNYIGSKDGLGSALVVKLRKLALGVAPCCSVAIFFFIYKNRMTPLLPKVFLDRAFTKNPGYWRNYRFSWIFTLSALPQYTAATVTIALLSLSKVTIPD